MVNQKVLIEKALTIIWRYGMKTYSVTIYTKDASFKVSEYFIPESIPKKGDSIILKGPIFLKVTGISYILNNNHTEIVIKAVYN